MLGRNIFRQKALDKLAAPDELDRLLTVVSLKSWLPLGTLGFLCFTALAWSIFGRIPVTVDGMGVLINPGNVRGLQSQASGQLIELSIRVGQPIARGEVIAVLNQPELRKQLEQAESRLAELIESDKDSDQLEATRWELEQQSTLAQREFLRSEVTKLHEMAQALLDKDQKYKEVQRKNLERAKDLTQKLHESIQRQFEQVRGLKAEGLAAGPLVLSTERDVTESQRRMADIEVQLRELDLREIQGAEKFLEQQNRISDMTMQLKQLDIAEQRLKQELTESNTRREHQVNDARRLVDRLKLDLERRSQVQSEYAGRVLELTVSPGQLVEAGERLGTIEVDDPASELRNLAYFQVKDGKQIETGMQIRVTPTTVQREREGAIIGEVVKVSSFPITRQGATNIVGNQEIAALLTQAGGMIEVEALLERDANSFSGYKWTSKGPPLKFSAGTTTTVRVTVEQRRPITYVLPILRTWVMGAKDEQMETTVKLKG